MGGFKRCVSMYPPMLDIIVSRERAVLEADGLVVDSIVGYAEERHKELHEKLQARIRAGDRGIILRAGGATFNTQSILSQWLPCDFFGIVGSDRYGEILERKVKGAPMNIHLDKGAACSTAWAYVFIAGDQRTIVAKQDPAARFSSEAKALILSKITEETIFYFVGFTFLLPEVARDSMEIVKMKRKTNHCIIINLSSEEVAGRFRDQILLAIYFCDFVMGNRKEFWQLFGKPGATEAEVLAWLDTLRVGYAITDGPGTVIGRFPGGSISRVDPPSVGSECHTNGAGDSFAAGFIGALKQGTVYKTKDIFPLLHSGIIASHAYMAKRS